MKKWLYASVVSMAVIGAFSLSPIFAAGPDATDRGAAPPGMEKGQKMTSVEVTDINKEQGTIQIKKPEGGQETFKLDEGAKAQLEQIQKGDKVDIEVVERNGEKIATSLTKSG